MPSKRRSFDAKPSFQAEFQIAKEPPKQQQLGVGHANRFLMNNRKVTSKS